MQYVTKEFYNCGESDFLYVISIYNGIIVKIDSVNEEPDKDNANKIKALLYYHFP